MSTIYPLNGSIKQLAQEANVLAAEGDRSMPSMTRRNLQIITGFKAACIRKLIWANLYFLALQNIFISFK